MTTTAPPAGKAYVIIEFNEETDEWKESGDRIKAASGWAAIRKHVDGRRLAGPDGASGERTFVQADEPVTGHAGVWGDRDGVAARTNSRP